MNDVSEQINKIKAEDRELFELIEALNIPADHYVDCIDPVYTVGDALWLHHEYDDTVEPVQITQSEWSELYARFTSYAETFMNFERGYVIRPPAGSHVRVIINERDSIGVVAATVRLGPFRCYL